ncbi:MAG: zinc dependent phospholipase C family protein [Syntrophales bacterium]|nr:zinc dependent phospholipase C family protein [Syntrophales bacterium]
MPKEVTHWLVAKETAKSLEGTPAGDAANIYPHSLLLGAVFPDIMFYARGRNRMHAHYYHGWEGRDTNYLLRQAAKRLNGLESTAWLSLLVGMISHVVTDTVFHPLVYYVTGNYEAKSDRERNLAIMAHRQFECLLDVFFARRENLPKIKLKDVVAHLEISVPDVAGLDPPAENEFPRALNNFALVQRYFSQPLMTEIFDLLDSMCPLSWRKVSALFYRRSLDDYLPILSRPFFYHHPVTGEKEQASVADLFRQSVILGKERVGLMMAALAEGSPVFTEKGMSLSFGVEGIPRYFAAQPFFGGRR